MAKLAILITALFAFFALTGRAESSGTLSSYKIHQPDPAALQVISRLFEIEHRHGTDFEIIVPSENSALFLALAPNAELLELDIAAAVRAKVRHYDHQALAAASRYRSFDEVQAWMKAHAFKHPELAKVVQYGSSRAGRPLSALRLSSSETAKPVVMITAATHGDELITTEVLMGLVDELIAGNGENDRISRILATHEIYFIPVVNPDGFATRNRYDGNSDPNRSYPWPGHENASPTPSIAGVIKFFGSVPVVASIDFHAYGELIMYPWAYTRTSIEPTQRTRFDNLTRNMAANNRYTYGPISEVIYVAPGSSADYYFWKSGSLSLGIEIGDSKVPSPSEIPSYVDSQRESTWRFLEAI